MAFWQKWFKASNKDHQQQLMESLLAMAWFVEARDPYTGGHLWRVSRYAQLLADAINLSEIDVARVGLGGFLHDLGKVGVPDAILQKPGRLSDEEYAQIKTHPDVGLRMLAGHPLAALVADAVSKHHERPDGQGYPYGLAAADIPMDANIVAICDAFDAMTSHRPYRKGMPEQKAIAIIQGEAGKQFDARLVSAFVGLAEQGKLKHIQGHSDDGIPLQDCPMCGPTLVVRKQQQANEHIYCRNCSGEFKLVPNQQQALIATPTNKMGTPTQLEPEADTELISRTVCSIVAVLPLEGLLAQP